MASGQYLPGRPRTKAPEFVAKQPRRDPPSRYLKDKTAKLRRLDMEIRVKQGALKEMDRRIEIKKRFFELLGDTPTVRQQKTALASLFREHDFSAIEELVLLAMDKGEALSVKERVGILKFLAEFEAPKPKSVDVVSDGARVSGVGQSIQIVNFHGIKREELEELHRLKARKAGKELMTDEQYAEFELDVKDDAEGLRLGGSGPVIEAEKVP